MKTIVTLAMLIACALAGANAQGYLPSFDHSVAVLDLASAEKEKRRAVPKSLPLPAYPFELMRANLRGEVKIRFLVLEDGSVGEVSVVSASIEEFGPPTKEAAASWKFIPVDRNGAPATVNVWMTCRVLFRMEED